MIRVIYRESVRNPQPAAAEIKTLVSGSVPDVSIATMKRELRRCGRFSFRPVKSPSLTPSQMRVRLLWARQRKDWTVDM